MTRRTWISLATFAALTAATLALRAPAGRAGAPPDLTGLWRLDRAASDAPRLDGARGPRAGRGAGPEGGMRRGGMRGGPGAAGGERRGRRGLPDLIHVTHTESLVSFEDSTGAVLQEITTTGTRDTLAHAPGARVLTGTWQDGVLAVTGAGPRGRTLAQSITLEEDGAVLVIRTRTEFEGAAREFKRVYRRDAS